MLHLENTLTKNVFSIKIKFIFLFELATIVTQLFFGEYATSYNPKMKTKKKGLKRQIAVALGIEDYI